MYYLNNAMKTLFFSIMFTALCVTQTYALACDDIIVNTADQLKRLENAKVRFFEQENITINSIQERKTLKINAIEEETATRITEIESIIEELESIKNPSKRIRSTYKTLRGTIDEYSTTTQIVTDIFNTAVDKILDDRSKSAKTFVEQYTFDTMQEYKNASSICLLTNSFDEDTFDSTILMIRKKVLESQKNTRRMTQGIDASYAKLTLDLNALDEELKNALKSIRPIIKKELKSKEAPLSFHHLFQI